MTAPTLPDVHRDELGYEWVLDRVTGMHWCAERGMLLPLDVAVAEYGTAEVAS